MVEYLLRARWVNNMAIDNIARGIASKALHTSSQAGSGDMLASDYDNNNAVKNAGGVAQFVHNHISGVKSLIINLTEDEATSTYTADKTYDEIKSAYENGREVVINIDNKAVLPLMSAEFQATEGSFVFGYTKVQEGCTSIYTRGVSYYHTPTDDSWSDDDNICEPLLFVDQEPINVPVATPTLDEHATNKGYVDGALADATTTLESEISGKVPIVQAAEGTLKCYIQNGSKTDVCMISNSGMKNSIARYDNSGRLISSTIPTADSQLANKKYVDDTIATTTKGVVATTGGAISGDLQIGGSLTVAKTISALGTPTQDVDVATKGYTDTQISNAVADVIRKQSISVSANSSVNVELSNGVYLFAVADNAHGGLVHVAVYPDGVTISGLVNLNGWRCERVTGTNEVKLSNTATTNMDIYISSIGKGTYR